MARTRSQEAAIRNSSPDVLGKATQKSPDRVLKASQRHTRSTFAKASGNRKLSKTERSSIKPETVTTEIQSIRASLQAEKQERVQAADQNETQKDNDTCDAILVTKSGIPGHGATLEHARIALSEALEQGILKVHSIKGQIFVYNEEALHYTQAKMDVLELNRQNIALKDELEKLVYMQMLGGDPSAPISERS